MNKMKYTQITENMISAELFMRYFDHQLKRAL